MKETEKLITYGVLLIIAYVLFTRYSATVAAAKATAAGNSTAGIIGASVGGLGAILGSGVLSGSDDPDYADDDY